MWSIQEIEDKTQLVYNIIGERSQTYGVYEDRLRALHAAAVLVKLQKIVRRVKC